MGSRVSGERVCAREKGGCGAVAADLSEGKDLLHGPWSCDS